jgi:NAD-dependent DNA ligase
VAGSTTTVDAVAAACRAWEERRDRLDFEIDGVVVKVDDLGAAALSWAWSGASRAGRSPGSSRP